MSVGPFRRILGQVHSPVVEDGVAWYLVDGHYVHPLVHVDLTWLQSCSCGDSLVGTLDAVDCFVDIVVDVVGCSLVVVVVVV